MEKLKKGEWKEKCYNEREKVKNRLSEQKKKWTREKTEKLKKRIKGKVKK